MNKKTDLNPAQSLLIARGQYYKLLFNSDGTVATSLIIRREIYAAPDSRYFWKDTYLTGGDKGKSYVEPVTPGRAAEAQNKLKSYAAKMKTEYYELATI